VPTYDYQCRSCGQITEVVHSMTEDGPSTCERCGGALRRVLYPTGIIFKGSGFYSTDSRSSRSSPRRGAAAAGGTGAGSAEGGASAGSSDGSGSGSGTTGGGGTTGGSSSGGESGGATAPGPAKP
jgi:putative FmdB family regulatory protein